MPLPELTRAVASHTRWARVFGSAGSPFTAQLLLQQPLHFPRTWSAGRHAPDVTLTLEFDSPITTLRLCPRMAPIKEGVVSLVVVLLTPSEEDEATATAATTTARVAHSELWRDGLWVAVALPAPTRALRIEFVESPSWIALYAVEGLF